jgi:hypothetical protein
MRLHFLEGKGSSDGKGAAPPFRSPRAALVKYFEVVQLDRGIRRSLLSKSNHSKIFAPRELCVADHFQSEDFCPSALLGDRHPVI